MFQQQLNNSTYVTQKEIRIIEQNRNVNDLESLNYQLKQENQN